MTSPASLSCDEDEPEPTVTRGGAPPSLGSLDRAIAHRHARGCAWV
jgi:hypothetical protein